METTEGFFKEKRITNLKKPTLVAIDNRELLIVPRVFHQTSQSPRFFRATQANWSGSIEQKTLEEAQQMLIDQKTQPYLNENPEGWTITESKNVFRKTQVQQVSLCDQDTSLSKTEWQLIPPHKRVQLTFGGDTITVEQRGGFYILDKLQSELVLQPDTPFRFGSLQDSTQNDIILPFSHVSPLQGIVMGTDSGLLIRNKNPYSKINIALKETENQPEDRNLTYMQNKMSFFASSESDGSPLYHTTDDGRQLPVRALNFFVNNNTGEIIMFSTDFPKSFEQNPAIKRGVLNVVVEQQGAALPIVGLTEIGALSDETKRVLQQSINLWNATQTVRITKS